MMKFMGTLGSIYFEFVRFWCILHPGVHVMRCSWMVEVWMRSHLVGDGECNLCEFVMLVFCFLNKEWQLVRGVRLVFMTLHM